jgi:hypothetical protein
MNSYKTDTFIAYRISLLLIYCSKIIVKTVIICKLIFRQYLSKNKFSYNCGEPNTHEITRTESVLKTMLTATKSKLLKPSFERQKN